MRFTAFVNREAAAAGDGPWGELLPAVTVPVQRPQPRAVGARRAAAAAAAGSPRGRRPRAQPRQHRAAVGSLPARGHRARPDLRALPRGPLGPARQGHARARAGRGAPLRPRDRRLAEHPRATSSSCWASPATQIDVVPLGLGAVQRAAAAPPEDERARASSSASARVVLSLSAKRPHKNLPALIGALALIPRRAPPAARAARLPDRARGASCARVRRRSGSRADVRFLGWVSERGARGPVGDRRVRSCSPRCTRASGCRCSRRWRAACRSPARTPPRCRRSPATRRCCSTRATSGAIAAAARAPAWRRGPRASGCARAGTLRAARQFTWERTARLTLDS